MLSTIKTFIHSINSSWLNLKLQTVLILTVITLMPILISSITSWPILTLSNSANINNSRFIDDTNFLVKNEILSLIEENRVNEINSFCEFFYHNSINLRYIIFVNKNGFEYGIPYSYNEVSANYQFIKVINYLNFQKLLPNNIISFDLPTLKIIILRSQENLGLLLIGNNSNFALLKNGIIINEIIIISTAFIFVIVTILIVIFLNLTITRPLREVSNGLLSIAEGNFSKRITLRFSGESGNLITSFNDLTRQLRLYEETKREQLLGEKIKLESLITTITDGALLLDTDLRIVLLNISAMKIFGWKTKTKFIGTTIWDYLPTSLQKKMFIALQDISFDYQNASFDGKIENELTQLPKRSVRIILNIVYDSSGLKKNPIGIWVTIRDITKEFELDKTQTRFISNISHELRTPLFNIKSFIETIQEYDYTISKRQKKYFLDIVNKETNRLTSLVNDILCISKLDSSQDLPLSTVDFVQTINQVIASYQILARDKKLFLYSEITINRLLVSGNENLLSQVLTNLVGNALKFTYKKGEIVVRAYKMKNDTIRTEVLDTGIGIVYSYQQCILQRFYRVENQVHTLKGTGLGLSIVDTILSEHKTKINIISRYNVGSAFWFDLRL